MEPITPKLTVDGIIKTDGGVVLIKRLNPPFQDMWALPGGFVDVGETCEAACIREIEEETGLIVEIEMLHGVYSDPDRDPRVHTVSVIYLVNPVGGELKAADDARDACVFSDLSDIELAFDHKKILEDARLIKS